MLAKSQDAGLRRRPWPLAVSLAVHAVLIGLWVRHADLRPVQQDVPEPMSVMLVPVPHRAEPAPAPKLKPDEKKTRRRERVTEPVTATVTPPPPVAVVPAVVPEPAVAAAKPSTAEILAAARKDIGKFDREPSGGKLGAAQGRELRAADSAWDRFGQRVADAKIDHAPAPNREAYTAPDGLTYYRTRVGNKYVCRKTGTLDPSSTWKNDREMHGNSMSTLGMGGTAGLVDCPGSERDWKRQ